MSLSAEETQSIIENVRLFLTQKPNNLTLDSYDLIMSNEALRNAIDSDPEVVRIMESFSRWVQNQNASRGILPPPTENWP